MKTAERRFLRFRSKFMDKPFKTIEEQIEILESRGMRTDGDTALALMREGYYSIVNGYKDLFIDREATAAEDHDVYRTGTTFKEVHRLFTFDRDLRLTMFRYFSIAEAALKTACAYRFSEKHAGEFEPYLNKGNYRQDRKHSKWIDDLILDFNTALGRNPKKKPKRKAYLEHYRSNHDEVPLWVLLRYMTLGQSFKFFEFQDESMRNEIAKHFSETYEETHLKPVRIDPRRLRLAFDHVKDFRNICAHEERLYCARVSPAKDVTIADAISDLGLLLPKEEDLRMVREVVTLILGIANDLNVVALPDLLESMGIGAIEDAFYVRD